MSKEHKFPAWYQQKSVEPLRHRNKHRMELQESGTIQRDPCRVNDRTVPKSNCNFDVKRGNYVPIGDPNVEYDGFKLVSKVKNESHYKSPFKPQPALEGLFPPKNKPKKQPKNSKPQPMFSEAELQQLQDAGLL